MKSKLIFDGVISRLKTATKVTQDNEISELLGMKPGTFHGRKKAESLPFEEILSLANQKKIDLNWLINGESALCNNEKVDFQPADLKYIDKSSLKEWQDFELIPFYDVEASAGFGSLVDQEHKIGEMAFRRDWLSEMSLDVRYSALIKARGDSMEPTLHDGDLLLVDMRFNEIKDDAIYILQADNHLIVKRVQLSLDGTLNIISDNPRYATQTISAERTKEVKIAGRLRWYGHEI